MKIHRKKSFFPAQYYLNTSTLLIPKYLYVKFLTKISEHKGCREYFNHLLNHCFTGSLEYHLQTRVRTEYQFKGQNLQKYNFRPYDEDWLHLKLLANAMGISMTSLFVLMMIEEEERIDAGILFSKNPRVHTKPIIISLKQTAIISDLVHFQKKSQLRI